MTRRIRLAGKAIAGLILAGGRSSRMGGATKALLPLAGKPLLQHVIERVEPQVDGLMLSVERRSEEYEVFGLQQVPDAQADGGPLGGLLAGLQSMDKGFDWLLLVPCDAPFVPSGLAAGLLACAMESDMPGAVIRYNDEVQPTFSIWHRRILDQVERAVTIQHMAGFKQFLRVQELAGLDWPATQPSPFFNINERVALLDAERLFETQNG